VFVIINVVFVLITVLYVLFDVEEYILRIELPQAFHSDELDWGLETIVICPIAEPHRLKVLCEYFFAHEILDSDVGGFRGAKRVAVISSVTSIRIKLAFLRGVSEKVVGITSVSINVS